MSNERHIRHVILLILKLKLICNEFRFHTNIQMMLKGIRYLSKKGNIINFDSLSAFHNSKQISFDTFKY